MIFKSPSEMDEGARTQDCSIVNRLIHSLISPRDGLQSVPLAIIWLGNNYSMCQNFLDPSQTLVSDLSAQIVLNHFGQSQRNVKNDYSETFRAILGSGLSELIRFPVQRCLSMLKPSPNRKLYYSLK